MLSTAILRKFSLGLSFNIRYKSMRIPSRNSFGKRKNIIPKLQPLISPNFANQSVGFHSLAKPFLFTVCFSGGIFACASLWQYETMRKKALGLRFGFNSNHSRSGIGWQLTAWWHRLTEGQKVASVIIAANACVFLMWRIPALQPLMQKYFTACPSMRSNCLPMLLSTFSHYSFLHMATNMYVLYSFSSGSVAFFGKEQFAALYLSSGVISSFASYAYKIATNRFGPSLGASGALMAILSSTCLQFPHTQLALVFFPFFTISAGKAIKALMICDFIGLIAKWRVFDHAAHLGGATFGIFYIYYGRDYIWGKRERLVRWWHNRREKSR